MVNSCSVPRLITNHDAREKETVFNLPKDKDIQIKKLSFLNSNDLETQKHVSVCYERFAYKFVKKSNHQYPLNCSMNPLPNILPASQSTTNVSEAKHE